MTFFSFITAKHSSQNSLCTFNGTFQCKSLPRHIIGKISIPPTACLIHNCHTCIRTYKSYLLSEDFLLLEPRKFILRHLNEQSDNAPSTSYDCFTKDNTHCDCEVHETCSGDAEYCAFRNCTENASCYCHLTHLKPLLVAVTSSSTISNPSIISLEVCLFDRNNFPKKRVLHRKLLESETAIFTHLNLTIKFEDPVLMLPDRGKVILRSEDYEHILSVPDDFLITIPFELLAYKTDIQVTYIHTSGKTVSGTIHVTGKSTCQLRICFLCVDIFRNIRCYSPIIQYIFYAAIIIITLIILMCIKIFLKNIIFIFQCFMMIFYFIYKLAKLIARCSLLAGAFFGSTIRDIVLNTYHNLEAHAVNRANIASLPLVLLLCCSIITTTYADCNNHAIVQTDLQTCEVFQDGSQQCKLHTNNTVLQYRIRLLQIPALKLL